MKKRLGVRPLFVLMLAVGVSGNPVCGQGVRLAETYRPTLDYSDEGIGRDWTSTKQDVWSLSSFGYSVGGRFEIRLGPSAVVFGRHGTNVVWAAVIPDEPGKLLKAPAGAGENVTSIFLRFHPQLVQKIFPPAIVRGNGPAERLIPARRVYQYKINAGWQTGNLPVVPKENSITFDCETAQGNRRRFEHDTDAGAVNYHSFFLKRSIPDVDSPGVTARPDRAPTHGC